MNAAPSPRTTMPFVVHASPTGNSGLPEINETQVQTEGAVLYRGFNIRQASEFRNAVAPVMGDLAPYAGGVGFKRELADHIYASTKVPRVLTISPHSELAYTQRPPRFLSFWCETPATSGGETSIVCARRVYQGISETTRRAFQERGIRYIRTYPSDSALVRLINRRNLLWPSWQHVFETEDRDVVTTHCESLGLTHRWSGSGALTTIATRPGIEYDPEGRAVWLNQAHTFCPAPAANGWPLYVLTKGLRWLPPTRQATAQFSDGGLIPFGMLEEIHAVMQREMHLVQWQRGDLLVIDNHTTLHGRMSFRGQRALWTAMGYGRVANTK